MKIPDNIKVCAVTKGRSIREIEQMLEEYPAIKIIAENRWPDCEEKFRHFKNLEKHFIGPLQSNKIPKVLPLVDVIQSIDNKSLLEKINQAALDLDKEISFCIQVNISNDPLKHGIKETELVEFIEYYLSNDFKNIQLIGLMTIGEQSDRSERSEYFAKLKKLFDEINEKYFSQDPLKILSMGMSDDYDLAIQEGASMIRLGRALWE